jgi:hypothetical protein
MRNFSKTTPACQCGTCRMPNNVPAGIGVVKKTSVQTGIALLNMAGHFKPGPERGQ